MAYTDADLEQTPLLINDQNIFWVSSFTYHNTPADDEGQVDDALKLNIIKFKGQLVKLKSI